MRLLTGSEPLKVSRWLAGEQRVAERGSVAQGCAGVHGGEWLIGSH